MKNSMHKRYSIVITAIVLLTASPAFCQFKPKTLRIGFYNQAVSLPNFKVAKLPIHPALNLGSDIFLRHGKHFHQSLGVDGYFYTHRTLENALMLDVSYKFGYHFPFKLQVNLLTALGYKYAILTGDKFRRNEGGDYERIAHSGKSMGNIKIGVGLAQPISQHTLVFVEYKAMAAGPSGGFFVPVSLQTFFGVGLQRKLSNRQ